LSPDHAWGSEKDIIGTMCPLPFDNQQATVVNGVFQTAIVNVKFSAEAGLMVVLA
jgi:hypothetical protein